MRLRVRHSIDGGRRNRESGIPLPFQFASGGFTFVLARDEGGKLVATVETSVSASALEHRPDEFGPDGKLRNSGGVVVADRPAVSEFGNAVVDALALLYDAPMQLASLGGELVPDTEQDERLLARLGTSREYNPILLFVDLGGALRVPDLGAAIEVLLSRRAGLDLYHEAMRLERPVSRFRELWRVLESAFGSKDAKLVELLADYEPAKQMGFTRRELRDLHTLRGRASHAASGAGLPQLHKVNMEVRASVGRLHSLARHVLLTKKTWGKPTTTVERVARAGWIGPPADR